MATKPPTTPTEQPPSATEPEVAFTPAPAMEDALNEPLDTEMAERVGAADPNGTERIPIEAAADGSMSDLLVGAGTRYRVLSGGISTATGARFTGEIVTVEQLGPPTRIAKLLDKKAIEVVTDD